MEILCVFTWVFVIHQSCQWCTPWISTQNSLWRILYFQNVITFHGTGKNVILFTLLIKVLTFPMLIVTKLTNPEEQYLPKLYAEFVPYCTMNVESKDINSFRPTRKVQVCLTSIFLNLEITGYIFVDMHATEI
jgi:hypothetical protein